MFERNTVIGAGPLQDVKNGLALLKGHRGIEDPAVAGTYPALAESSLSQLFRIVSQRIETVQERLTGSGVAVGLGIAVGFAVDTAEEDSVPSGFSEAASFSDDSDAAAVTLLSAGFSALEAAVSGSVSASSCTAGC